MRIENPLPQKENKIRQSGFATSHRGHEKSREA